MNAIPEGQCVRRYRYGMGVVTESDDRQTPIDFDVHGLNRFVTTLMVVELSDLTPPRACAPSKVPKSLIGLHPSPVRNPPRRAGAVSPDLAPGKAQLN